MVLFFEFLITIFKILAIVIIALPISGLLFPKNPTWKLSNFLKFLFNYKRLSYGLEVIGGGYTQGALISFLYSE